MVLISRTLLLIFCVLIIAAEGINGGVIQKRLQLFKNAQSHVRKFSVPLEVEHHRVRRVCHHNDHVHNHEHDHHPGYVLHHKHSHHHGHVHHHKHDHHHDHGHHHKHGHHLVKDRKLPFGRALYQGPYYHVSPQLFYSYKNPLNLGFSQHYRNKFFPYLFTRYNNSPYQVKPLMHTYNYHVKPMYFYLRNPQILPPVPQYQEYHLYPIHNQVSSSSENSLNVVDDNRRPFNNPITDNNVHDTSFEETGTMHAQIPVQNSDLNSENYQSVENDKVSIISDLEADGTNTTPISENKICNVQTNEESTSHNISPEHTTHQYTIDLDEMNESSTVSVRITGSFDNDTDDSTTSEDQSRVSITRPDGGSNFALLDGIKTTSPSNEESITEKSYSTHEPVVITDYLEHDVTNGNEPSLKDVNEQTVTYYSPLETFHDQTTEISVERDQVVGLEDNLGLITGSDNENWNGGLKYETSAGTTIFELLMTKSNDYHPSTTRSFYDVTTAEVVTEKNDVDLFDHDQTHTTIESHENDELKEYEGSTTLQTIPQNRFEEHTTEPFFNYQDHTTNESFKDDELKEYEGLPTLQTVPQNRFEEPTTEPSSNEQDHTTSESLKNDELKAYEVSITLQTIPQNRFEEPTTKPSTNEQDHTTSQSPKNDEFKEYEGSPTLQTVPQNRFEEPTTVPSSNEQDHTTSESLKNDELKAYEGSITLQTIPQNRFEEPTTKPSTNEQDHTTSQSPKNDEFKEYEGSPTLQTVPQNRFEEPTAVPSSNEQDHTSQSPKNDEFKEYEGLPTLQTVPRNRFEEPTTEPFFNYQDHTTSESSKNDELKEYEGSPTFQTVPQNRFEEPTTEPSSNEQDHTTSESPKNDELKEYEGSITLQTIPQNRFEEPNTVYSNSNYEPSTFFPEPSFDESSDQDILLFEEMLSNFLEGATTLPEIIYSSELIQSKTGIEIDHPNKKTGVSFVGDVSSDAIDSSIEETSVIYNLKLTTELPAHTTSFIDTNKVSADNVYKELEAERNLKITLNSIDTTISTPILKELTEEEFVRQHTVPVTGSSMFTDFEEEPAWKSNINTSPSASSMFTDFTENSETFPKLKSQIMTTYSPPSIFTDTTENSKGEQSEFKFETNAISTTPFSVYNDFTENYILSTPNSSRNIENPDFSSANIMVEESSENVLENDVVTEKILENVAGNTGIEDAFNSVEITAHDYTNGNWNMEKNIKSADEKNSTSEVVEDESVFILENGAKNTISGAGNEEISVEFSETTTLRSSALKPSETERDELLEVEKEDTTGLKSDDSEKQFITNINIATEKYLLIPEDVTNVTQKHLEDDHYYSNAVTSKSDLVGSEVFEVIDPTTMSQDNKIEQSSVTTDRNFENTRIGSNNKFSELTTTPILETFDSYSSNVEDREIYTHSFSSNIQDMENLATIFGHHGDIENSADLIVTTESTFVTDLNDVGKITPYSEYDNETPTTKTPLEYFHGNLFEEIKNFITTVPAPTDIQYSEVTDADDLDETTRLLRTDQHEQTINMVTTILPNKLKSQNSIDAFNNGEDGFDKISDENHASGSWFVENENITDYDELLLSLESSSETNIDSRRNISSEQLNVEGGSSNGNDKNSENQAEEEKNNLNELLEKFSQTEENLQSTSPNYEPIVENYIDHTTISSESSAEGGIKPNNLSKEGSIEVKYEIVFVQSLLNDTARVHNTSKVIDDLQSNVDDYSDGVLRVYEELDTSLPSSEIAPLNVEYKKPEAVDEKNHAPEGLESVTEIIIEQDSEKKNTEIFLTEQISEPLLIENSNEKENQEVDIAAKTKDESDTIETSTRAHLRDYTEMESILGENKGEEIRSQNLNSENEYSPFHLDLLNYNDTTHDSSKKELSNIPSMIEEITYYNMKNLEGDSDGDNIFVAVNEEETNRTGLLSANDYIDVVGDNPTNNYYELTRSVRYEYINPDYFVSNNNSNITMLNSNNMKYQNDRSAKPRYIAKRDVIKANASQMPDESEELITEKKEIKSEASEVLAMLEKGSISSYLGDEAYDDDDDDDYENDNNDYESLNNANPLDLIEVKDEEEDETKLTQNSGPSIMDLIYLNPRLKKQFS